LLQRGIHAPTGLATARLPAALRSVPCSSALPRGARLGYSARMKNTLLVLLLAGLAGFALTGLAGFAAAKPWWVRGVESNDSDFLDPNVAFRVSAAVDGNVIQVRWVIADGYYLYRQRMDLKPESPDLVLSPPQFPKGILKVDPYFGSQEIYKQQVEVSVPFSRVDGGAHPLAIKVTYQGCAEAGLCYPPITRVLSPEHPAAAAVAVSHPWEGVAIGGGGFAFLLAGLLLRKGRQLDLPAA
jgi:thiol:disulfide interchange protein